MKALRWLWRTDGALMGLSAIFWCASALQAGEWALAFGCALFGVWFAAHAAQQTLGPREFNFVLPDGRSPVTVTVRADGTPTEVHLREPGEGWRSL